MKKTSNSKPTVETSQVKNSAYFRSTYDTKERFCSYWHQIDEVLQLKPKNVLEIGVGNSFVTRYLQGKGTNVTTLDIAHDLQPDVAGSVLTIPFINASFDAVTCYQVLEHLPYESFPESLEELARVSQCHVIISLPDATTVYRVNIELPRIEPIRKLIPHPFPRATTQAYDGAHYWEIGKRQYPLEKIVRDIEKSNLTITKTYRVFEFYYHRFFILTKC
jgi:ubiquinone/menaquinone biosynthesis C-methylase UbiE